LSSPGLGRSGGGGFLILRRDGVLWGIDNAAVAGLTRRSDRFRIDIRVGAIGIGAGGQGGRALAADDILCVVDGLRVWPLAAAVRRFCPGVAAGVAGMAVHGEQPLLLVDPRQPPRLLWLEEGEGIDGEGCE
jgi:hypothetical protein